MMASLRNLLLLSAVPAVLGGVLLDLLHPDPTYPEEPYPELPCPEPTSTPPPELSCDKYGYLIQFAELIRVDLATGDYETVGNNLGDGSSINALGYNPQDNLLYGYQASTEEIIQIASDGSSSAVTKVPNAAGYILGDFDAEGYYWAATNSAAAWIKVDLRPGSSAYGNVVESGTTPSVERTTADWVHVPAAGEYLWSAGVNSAGGTSLLRWGFDTHEWEIVAEYADVENGFGALYGINNGTIFASNNRSGRIWAFSVTDDAEPYVASQGPPSNSNDGARCVSNLEV